MNNDLMFSSASCEWPTPQKFFDELNEEFQFTLDAAADRENHKCDRFFTKEEDGLAQSWSFERVFCNPPYGKDVWKWCRKALAETRDGECEIAVLLLPSRTDTRWFHDWVYGIAEIRFVRGRLCFGHKDRAPFPSLVAVYRRVNSTKLLNKGRVTHWMPLPEAPGDCHGLRPRNDGEVDNG